MALEKLHKSSEQNLKILESDIDVEEPTPRSRKSNAYLKYVSKKLVYYIIAFFIAVSLTFLIPRLLPDQISIILSNSSLNVADPIYQARLAQLREYFRIDQPPLEGLLDFWLDFFKLDLGPSLYYYPTPVLDRILPRIPYTL